MNTYEEVIALAIHEAFPSLPAAPSITFEAVSKEVLGTKQRRFGPMPSPETQTSIRAVIRNAMEGRETPLLRFFLPWGCSKQQEGEGIDILELYAIKQLRCLQEGLNQYGVSATFQFRIEDNTDRYLFGRQRELQILTYREDFTRMIHAVLPGSRPMFESQRISYGGFAGSADAYAPVFFSYLKGEVAINALRDLGWKGDIPEEQRAYYREAYKLFYPNSDPNWEMAKYFAATLARVNLGATCAPGEEHLLIAFTHPVPGNPISKNRIYYRTIPERYTNTHKSPWLAKGYFKIGDDNSCTPRIASHNELLRLTKHTIDVGGAKVQADYLVDD